MEDDKLSLDTAFTYVMTTLEHPETVFSYVMTTLEHPENTKEKEV